MSTEQGITRLIFLVAIITCANGLMCLTNEYEYGGRCCQLCPRGTHLKQHCSAEVPQTQCAPCQNGTFSSDWTLEPSCTPCTVLHNCRPGMKLSQKCTAVTDNRCGCILANQFLDTDLDFCMACKKCSPGEYPERPCSKRTSCIKCPRNTFSNRTNNYSWKCQRCTVCSVYKRKCNTTFDAICDVANTGAIPSTTYTTTVKSSKALALNTSSDPTTEPRKSESKSLFQDSKLIMIIFPIVIFLLILGTVLFIRHKKGLCRTRTRFAMIEESIYTQLNTGVLLRNAPYTLVLGVHGMINPDGPKNWRNLAAELGFTYNDIANFAVERTRSAESMLASWQTRSSSTVDRLHEALLKIGREDAAHFVAETMSQFAEDEEE